MRRTKATSPAANPVPDLLLNGAGSVFRRKPDICSDRCVVVPGLLNQRRNEFHIQRIGRDCSCRLVCAHPTLGLRHIDDARLAGGIEGSPKIKRVRGGTMSTQMIVARIGIEPRRQVAGRNPPRHIAGPARFDEPVFAFSQRLAVRPAVGISEHRFQARW